MVARRYTFRRLPPLAWIIAVVATVATAQPQTTASLVVNSENKSGIYSLGTEVLFTVKSAEGAEPVDIEKVAATITQDGWKEFTAAEIKRAGGTIEIRFTPQAPGWYMCEAVPDGNRRAAARAGVVVAPEKIAPSMPEPDDFDEFWNARRAALAAMPMKADLAPVESPDPQIECFSIEIPCPQTNPVRGYYACPKAAEPKSAPAILYVRAAGVSGDWCKASTRNATWLAKQHGAIVVDINAHGMLNDQPAEYYHNLEQNELRNYPHQGVNDRDKFYFVGMYVRLMRAIEFIASREVWDGTRIITIGESQGGGQALAAAGLDKRISGVVALVPAMCDFAGPVVDRVGGWPQPLGRDIESENARKVIAAVRYCDNVNLARRSRAETLIFVGLIDTACSAPGIFATCNTLQGDKRIVAYPHKPHNGLPEEDRWIGDISTLRDEFIRKHFGR